jgi:hypothetical protein
MCFLLRTFAKRIGRTDLSLLAAARGIASAHQADDPLRLAAAWWNLGHILLAQDEAAGAEEIAIRAAEELRPQLENGTDWRRCAVPCGLSRLWPLSTRVMRGRPGAGFVSMRGLPLGCR